MIYCMSLRHALRVLISVLRARKSSLSTKDPEFCETRAGTEKHRVFQMELLRMRTPHSRMLPAQLLMSFLKT